MKAVRAVSGLNAVLPLLEDGYAVEACVILRTVDDFVDETAFLLDAHESGNPTKAQQSFIKHFFDEKVPTPEEMLQDRQGVDRAKRKDIRAAQGRFLQPENPDRVRRMAMGIDGTFDGYVHGAYPQSMELYYGGQFPDGDHVNHTSVGRVVREFALIVPGVMGALAGDSWCSPLGFAAGG